MRAYRKGRTVVATLLHNVIDRYLTFPELEIVRHGMTAEYEIRRAHRWPFSKRGRYTSDCWRHYCDSNDTIIPLTRAELRAVRDVCDFWLSRNP